MTQVILSSKGGIHDDWAFVHVPRTGGTSIRNALEARTEHPVRQHATAAELRRYLGQDGWDRRFTFGFVRNPWDRLVSLWARRAEPHTRTPKHFRAWLQSDTFHPLWRVSQVEQLSIDGRIAVNFVGRFERFGLDFHRLCNLMHKPHVQILRLNHSSKGGDYTAYYNDETRDLVAHNYKDDIEAFRYDF